MEGEDSRRKRGREKPKARSISFIPKPEDRFILLLFNKKVFFFPYTTLCQNGSERSWTQHSCFSYCSANCVDSWSVAPKWYLFQFIECLYLYHLPVPYGVYSKNSNIRNDPMDATLVDQTHQSSITFILNACWYVLLYPSDVSDSTLCLNDCSAGVINICVYTVRHLWKSSFHHCCAAAW